ncbi:hypothetical protein ACFFQW_36850 [Umezawaea endophytica]|uniref:Uncharacterized protein n=1 Tax=Umezawaea endophytica TaxID=1654476 RepID=A0A9X2VUY0_9PSEU|nr:hypothetical protein [Umezawaea endophytica]MCS7483370.1 hypothetical protein [Umezawaea endophytica]
MTSALIVLAVLALVGYSLERNNSKQSGPHARLAGSNDVQDLDLVRMTADLRAASPAESTITTRRAPHFRGAGVRV